MKDDKTIIRDFFKRKAREPYCLLLYFSPFISALFLGPLSIFIAKYYQQYYRFYSIIPAGIFGAFLIFSLIYDGLNNRCPICDKTLERKYCSDCNIKIDIQNVFAYLESHKIDYDASNQNIRNLVVKAAYNASRCEICHQSDQLDFNSGFCKRCNQTTI
jgi:hypothetical protein